MISEIASQLHSNPISPRLPYAKRRDLAKRRSFLTKRKLRKPEFIGLSLRRRSLLAPRHSRESGNPDVFSQACYPKSSMNRSQRIPSLLMGEG